MVITSRENQTVKYVKKLNKKSFRDSEGVFVAEGERLVFDLYTKGAKILKLFVSREFTDISADEVHQVSDGVLECMSDTCNSQGILAVIKKPEYCPSDLGDTVVVCDRISDPGNMGTIIRTADSAGFTGVAVLPGCVDVYSPKVVRSTMGSLFGIPIVHVQLPDIISDRLVCGDLEGAECVYDFDFKPPFSVVIGNEAQGVSDEVRQACKSRIKIPMLGKSESLNAAVSFGVIAYEAVRQRKFK